MLFATAKSYLTSYLLPFTYYFPKNPAILGKSEEVKGKKQKSRTFVQDFLARVDKKDATLFCILYLIFHQFHCITLGVV